MTGSLTGSPTGSLTGSPRSLTGSLTGSPKGSATGSPTVWFTGSLKALISSLRRYAGLSKTTPANPNATTAQTQPLVRVRDALLVATMFFATYNKISLEARGNVHGHHFLF